MSQPSAEGRLRALRGLQQRERWLRTEVKRERMWIANLQRNEAPEWLADEHRQRLERYESLLAREEARINEWTP